MIGRKVARKERGAAAVETALVLGLLLTMALGAFEWGMALRDWMSVTAGSREGARIAASAGDTPNADCLILESAAGSLRNISEDQVMSIRIYKTTPAGVVGASQIYRPAVDTDAAASLRCSSWFSVSQAYPESSRDNKGATRDWVGVEIEFDHDWITNFAWWSGSVCDRGTTPGVDCWSQATVMHLEPDPTP